MCMYVYMAHIYAYICVLDECVYVCICVCVCICTCETVWCIVLCFPVSR